jgi:ribosome-associated protein
MRTYEPVSQHDGAKWGMLPFQKFQPRGQTMMTLLGTGPFRDDPDVGRHRPRPTFVGPVNSANMREKTADQFAIDLGRLAADLKSENVVTLDLRGISSVTDFAVIATGTSERQIRAVADRLIAFARTVGERPYGVAGLESGKWVVIDFVDVVIHVFAAAQREYYDLDLLWGDAPRLVWDCDAAPPVGTG